MLPETGVIVFPSDNDAVSSIIVAKKAKSEGELIITGTKGYRWLESEEVYSKGMAADIDTSYYDSLVDKAISTIEQYTDFEMFRDPNTVNCMVEDKDLPI